MSGRHNSLRGYYGQELLAPSFIQPHLGATVVRLRLPELLEELDWTPYRLAKELDMTGPAVYRLVSRRGRFARLSATMLDRLCEITGQPPGKLLEWVPNKRRGK
jgi:DNA-binding Xre family transcriptional regulator